MKHGGGNVVVYGCLAALWSEQHAVIDGTTNYAVNQKIHQSSVQSSVNGVGFATRQQSEAQEQVHI